MDDRKQRDWKRKALVAGVFIGALVAVLLVNFLPGCGTQPHKKVVVEPPATDGGGGQTPDCGGLSIGQTKLEACPIGQTGEKTSTCAADGLHVQDTCKPAQGSGDGRKPCSEVVTFANVQTTLAQSCAGCHAAIDTYDRARAVYTQAPDGKPGILPNVQAGSALHMPPGGQLPDAEIAALKKWGDDGFLKADECDAQQGGGQQPPPPAPSYPELERTLYADGSNRNVVDQPHTRWLVYTDRMHAGAGQAELAVYRQAAAKATASVSPERDLFPPTLISPGVVRIDLDDLGISAAQWKRIEDASKLQLESFTQTGLALKALTSEGDIKTRMPWMLVSEFVDTVLHNPSIYYDLTRSPNTLQQLLVNLGVDFDGDLQASKALLVAFNGSQLSPAANRLMARFDAKATGGAFWLTEDTGPVVSDKQSVFKNPLIAGAGGVANLDFAAGEQIYVMNNGMLGMFLADKGGKRLDQADPQVVHDFTSNPITPFIVNSVSCYRCHAGGFIRAVDKVREAIPNAGLGAQDAQRALALYRGQAEIDRVLASDNAKYAAALRALGVDPTKPDPIAAVIDKHLGDLTLADVAGIYGQGPDEFKRNCLDVSEDVRALAQQLATPNGTIAHDQLALISKTIQDDCRTFRDPL